MAGRDARTLSPKADTSKAILYALNRWEALTRYRDDGRMEIDNLPFEHALRGVAIVRSIHLFAGANSGGERAAVMYSLIGSDHLTGIDPEAYQHDFIEHIAAHPVKRIKERLPWNVPPLVAASARINLVR